MFEAVNNTTTFYGTINLPILWDATIYGASWLIVHKANRFQIEKIHLNFNLNREPFFLSIFQGSSACYTFP